MLATLLFLLDLVPFSAELFHNKLFDDTVPPQGWYSQTTFCVPALQQAVIGSPIVLYLNGYCIVLYLTALLAQRRSAWLLYNYKFRMLEILPGKHQNKTMRFWNVLRYILIYYTGSVLLQTGCVLFVKILFNTTLDVVQWMLGNVSKKLKYRNRIWRVWGYYTMYVCETAVYIPVLSVYQWYSWFMVFVPCVSRRVFVRIDNRVCGVWVCGIGVVDKSRLLNKVGTKFGLNGYIDLLLNGQPVRRKLEVEGLSLIHI